jgi:hypothetical protein
VAEVAQVTEVAEGDGGGAGEIEIEIETEIEYIRNFVAISIDTTRTPVGRALKGRRFGVQ